MAKYLVIVESPAKVKTIKKFLGKNYEVAASNGHVRDLPKSQLGVDVEHDFEPKYITIRGKGDILANLRKEVKKADKVYLATDPDREGEAISWHLSKALKLEGKDVNRISFNEITQSAVKASLKQVLIAKGIFNPLRNMSSPIFAVIGTVIMGRIFKEIARLVWGATAFNIPGYLKGTYKLGHVVITRANVIIIVVSIIIVAALQVFFYHTKTGKAMRCVQQNKTASTLMGINVTSNINFTIALSAVICSCIGMLVVSLFSVSLTMSSMIGLKGFAAGVVGGFGSFPGAIIGGIVIGVVENISTLVIPPLYKDCISFVLMIVFMLVRPQGILGKKK